MQLLCRNALYGIRVPERHFAQLLIGTGLKFFPDLNPILFPNISIDLYRTAAAGMPILPVFQGKQRRVSPLSSQQFFQSPHPLG
jgi:hypothetical protein